MRESTAFDQPAAPRSLWLLDPKITFLNHGSFGACPKGVLRFQRAITGRLEREPITFLVREFESLLDEARAAMARFVGANPDDLVFVPNATSGINTVLRSFQFKRGDELLVTTHEYNASRNVLEFAAHASGAKVVTAELPFPIRNADEVCDRVFAAVTPRTRVALLDHVTSQTGLILPLERIVPALEKRGVRTLIDGAHAPGMIPLNLKKLGASFYTGNAHKWMCAPKSVAFLHVIPEFQQHIRPLVISHGANSARRDRSRFLIEFGWMGTRDPSPILSVPKAIEFIGSLLPGGWPAVMRHNRDLARLGRCILCETLEIEPPAPDAMIGSLASFPIPDSPTVTVPKSPLYLDALQERLFARHRIEVPIIPWPAPPKRLLRISAQLYNRAADYERLARALKTELRGE